MATVQGISAQTTHLIRGFDFYYDPDTLYMQPGDSVKFQPQGIHDMVQTDSSWWAINQAIPIGGFETEIGIDTTFVIDTVGTYYFVCSPHGFNGMRGVLLVDSALVTGTPPGFLPPKVSVAPNPANDLVRVSSSHARARWLELHDSKGDRLLWGISMRHGTAVLDVSNISAGRYVAVILDKEHRPLGTTVLMVLR